MRFVEFKETETATKIYAIGDSHAVAISGSGKFISLATNGRSAMSGANDDAIEKVSPGSTVVLSAGANDMLSANKSGVVGRINALISKLQAKDVKVFYVLFAETDNPKFAKDRNQLRQMVKASLPAGVEVVDMGKLSVANGDGIHAPMGWYSSAAGKVKAGAKPGQAPTPTPDSKVAKRGLFDPPANYIQVPTGPKMGSRGIEVINLQRALMALGYNIGPTKDDGIIGKFTSAAISKFQTDNKLPATGTATPETVEALNKAVAASPKATNLEKAKPEEFKGKIAVSALGDKESRALLSKEAQGQGIKGKELAAFLAQCSHESGGFRYLSEIWGPSTAQQGYEGRKDLGNVRKGDGYRYRGRGYIGLTGRTNYREAGGKLGLPLEEKPELVEQPDVAAKTAVLFWKTYVQPKVSNWDDVRTITRIINGGYNGLDDRMMRFAAFKQSMNIA
jgi:predicted chitinase